MDLRFCISFIAFACVLPLESAETRLSISQCVSMALTNNVDLQAASVRIAEARARVSQAGRLSNPELESEVEPNVRGREYSITIGFSQRFPVTARLRLEKELSRLHVKVAQAEVEDFRRKLASEVRAAAVSVAALDELKDLQQRQVQNTREIARAYADAAKVGEAAGIEAAQLNLAADQLEIERAQIEGQRNEGSRKLAVLLGTTNLVGVEAGISAPNLAADFPKIDHSVYESAERRIEAAHEAVKLARAARWEDVRVGLFAGIDRREDLPVGLRTDHSVGVRFSAPVPLWNKRNGQVAEAEAGATRMEKEAEALRRQIDSEIVIARGQMETALELSNALNGQLIPKARKIEEELSQLQKAGQASFADTLRARERRLSLEADEIRARRDAHLAWARLLAATGGDQ